MCYTACEDGTWLGDLYDYGHGDPAVVERRAEVHGPWLTVRLPASTRVRLTLRLALRTGKPSYATPFNDAGEQLADAGHPAAGPTRR